MDGSTDSAWYGFTGKRSGVFPAMPVRKPVRWGFPLRKYHVPRSVSAAAGASGHALWSVSILGTGSPYRKKRKNDGQFLKAWKIQFAEKEVLL